MYEECPIGKTYSAEGVGLSPLTSNRIGNSSNATENPDGSLLWLPDSPPPGGGPSTPAVDTPYLNQRDSSIYMSTSGISEVRQNFTHVHEDVADSFHGFQIRQSTGTFPFELTHGRNVITLYRFSVPVFSYSSFASQGDEVGTEFSLVVEGSDLTLTVNIKNATTGLEVSAESSATIASASVAVYYALRYTISGITLRESYLVGDGFPLMCDGIPDYIPIYPIETNISMSWETVELASGCIDILDNGAQYDSYYSTMMFKLATAQAEAFSYRAQESLRGTPALLSEWVGASIPDGFRPFGVHVAEGDPSVILEEYEDAGQGGPFGNFFQQEVTISPSGPLTLKAPSVITTGAGFRIDSLTDFDVPEMELESEYKVNTNKFGATVYQNHNEKTAQKPISRFTWTLCNDAAEAILSQLVRVIRANTFTVNGGANYYPFGVDYGQGDHICRLASGIIEVEQLTGNTTTVSCRVVRCG